MAATTTLLEQFDKLVSMLPSISSTIDMFLFIFSVYSIICFHLLFRDIDELRKRSEESLRKARGQTTRYEDRGWVYYARDSHHGYRLFHSKDVSQSVPPFGSDMPGPCPYGPALPLPGDILQDMADAFLSKPTQTFPSPFFREINTFSSDSNIPGPHPFRSVRPGGVSERATPITPKLETSPSGLGFSVAGSECLEEVEEAEGWCFL
ncbi:hypothetical protein F66182_7450 [Fusarium sp. NRRL 66182]|nr:hypothetical protein F66182_7450 [Fusarium sp. NRRL 66182]